MELIEYTDDNREKLTPSLIHCYKQVFAAPPWNEHWWTDELVEKVLNDYIGSNAKVILAVENDGVVGFAWGAYWTSKELSKELQIPLPYADSCIVGYIKDVGVMAEHRKHGLAKEMLRMLVSSISPHCTDVSPLLARTLAYPVPSVVYQWFPRIGFSTVAHYPKKHERASQVVLAHTLSLVSF